MEYVRDQISEHLEDESTPLDTSSQFWLLPGPVPDQFSPGTLEDQDVSLSIPGTLEKSKLNNTLDIIVDAMFLLLAFPFIALILAAFSINGKSVDEAEHQYLMEIVKIEITLFPYCFAAVLGRSAVKYAQWSLENGARIGLLEQLVGSRSLAGTVTTQLQLRRLNVIGICLIVIWCWSPLGGEDFYINTRAQHEAGYADFTSGWFNAFGALFGASLLTPMAVKRSGVDLWGNVKIPLQSNLSSVMDLDGWRILNEQQDSVKTQYSSLFGIPISGISSGNTSFLIESTYLELNCTRIESVAWSPNATGLLPTNGSYFTYTDATYAKQNWNLGYKGFDVSNLEPSPSLALQSLDFLPANTSTRVFEPGTLLFQDFSGRFNMTSVYCTPSQAYVESRVQCVNEGSSQACSVVAQRDSLLPHMPTALSMLSFTDVVWAIGELLPKAYLNYGYVELMQNHIYDQDLTFIQSADHIGEWGGESRFLNLSLEDFSIGLAQVLNSFIYSTMWNTTQYLTGANFELLKLDASTIGVWTTKNFTPAITNEDLTAAILNGTLAITVVGNVTTLSTVYSCSMLWVNVLLLSSLIMLLAAISSIVFGRRTLTPEYLGFVSTLARESRFTTSQKGAANLNGFERAKTMADEVIRLGDVGGVEDQVGLLAIGNVKVANRVRRGKLYL